MTELDLLLAEWGDSHRLSQTDAAVVRGNVLAVAESRFDTEWFWSLLRPLTSLIEEPGGRAMRHVYTPYLQLA